MKSLIIAEKPSVARDIARVLRCGKNQNGAIEGDKYIVTWGWGIWSHWPTRRIMTPDIRNGRWKTCR